MTKALYCTRSLHPTNQLVDNAIKMAAKKKNSPEACRYNIARERLRWTVGDHDSKPAVE